MTSRRSIQTCLLHGLCWLLLGTGAAADYKENIGYQRLLAEQGATTPDGTGIPVSMIEASTAGVDNPPAYLPDVNNPQFSGKSITDMSAAATGLVSSHATGTATRFFGNSTAIAPGIDTIHAFWADGWLQGDFLRFGSGLKPLVSTTRLANHSWVGDTGDALINAELLKRLDWLVDTDEFIQCVGVINSSAGNRVLLSNAYNAIVVGSSDGTNGYGTSPLDAVYVQGRTRPEIVAPQTTTSAATPVVCAAAALLVELGHTRPGLSADPLQTATSSRNGDTIYNAERSEVVKAVLMAGAARATANVDFVDLVDYRGSAADRTANGLDIRYGAGQVDIHNSFHILTAGEQNSDEDDAAGTGMIGAMGFDYDPSFGTDGDNATASYHFTAGAGPAMLSATLAWNIDIDGGSGPFFSGTAALADLDLLLFDVTGAPTQVAASTSLSDNTETIWIPLQPGRDYRLQVISKAGQDPFDRDYALAWLVAADTDGDGIPDTRDPDDDNDGLTDLEEMNFDGDPAYDPLTDTDPLNPDTDGDGISDYDELNYDGNPAYDPATDTNPLSSNTDGDAYPDATDPVPLDFNLEDGNVAPWGAPDGEVNAADLLVCMQFILGLRDPSSEDLARADLYPAGAPDGIIDLSDYLRLQMLVMP